MKNKTLYPTSTFWSVHHGKNPSEVTGWVIKNGKEIIADILLLEHDEFTQGRRKEDCWVFFEIGAKHNPVCYPTAWVALCAAVQCLGIDNGLL